MNCHELNHTLETKDANALGTTEQSAIERHFASCDACRNAWASFAEISSEQIPPISPELRSRIDELIAARLPTRPRSVRRTFIAGSLLVLGAAAAAIMLQVGERDEDLAAMPDQQPRATESLPSSEINETSLAGNPASDPAPRDGADSASAAEPPPALFALDPRSLVVILDAGSDADADELATLEECHRGVVARLRELPGLNVIAGVAVTAFQSTGMTHEQIARELGAASVLSLDELAFCNSSLSDSRTGAFMGGRIAATAIMAGDELTFDPDSLDWDRFYDGIARTVSDALLIDKTDLIAAAQATFLNTSLGEDERLAALYRISAATGSLPDAVFSEAVVAALVQIMTTSADLQNRRSAVLSVRGLDDASLVEPLLYVLSYDAETEVRRVAASTLHEYVDEPRVADALRRIVAEDPDDDPSVICCEFNLGMVARRALASDDELRALSLQQLMNTELTDSQRLRPLIDYPDGRDVVFVDKLDEAHSDVVFSIGRDSGNPADRSRAWQSLALGTRSAQYLPTLLDDLSSHGDEEVRHSAAEALAQYVDDAGVRAALERALATDPCECLGSILEPVLQAE